MARASLVRAQAMCAARLSSDNLSLPVLNPQLSVNGRPRAEVCRDHLLAMLQAHLMDIDGRFELWGLLSSKSVSSLAQYEAVLDLIEHEVMTKDDRIIAHSTARRHRVVFTPRQIKRNELVAHEEIGREGGAEEGDEGPPFDLFDSKLHEAHIYPDAP